MRGILWCFFLLGLGVAAARGAEMDELVRSAEDAFKNNRYADAVTKYDQLADQAPFDPVILYDLGTAHARAGQKGLAIWRYLQALQLQPRDADIRNNLRVLAPSLFEQTAISPIPPVDWLYAHFTGNEWAAAAGGATAAALLLAALLFWRGGRRGGLRWLVRWLILPLLVLAAVAWPLAITHYLVEELSWRGVVIAENTVARAGPSDAQIETDKLPVGTVVHIQQEDSGSGWYKFSYMGGRKGFVESSRVRPI